MKKSVITIAFAVFLSLGLNTSCCKGSYNDEIGDISASNGCGRLGGTYTLKGSNLSAHFTVTNTIATDTAYVYFDDIQLLEVIGVQTKETDYNNADVSQGIHYFKLVNGCGSCSTSVGGISVQ